MLRALVDGDYPVSGRWPTDPGSPLQFEMFRFEQCAVLPDFICEDPGRPYTPDQLGVDGSAVRTMTLPLDDTVRVVVAGWGQDPEDFGVLAVEQATGFEMAALLNEVDRAYSEVFTERFTGGEDPDAIIADVTANPTGGFALAAGAQGAVLFALPLVRRCCSNRSSRTLLTNAWRVAALTCSRFDRFRWSTGRWPSTCSLATIRE